MLRSSFMALGAIALIVLVQVFGWCGGENAEGFIRRYATRPLPH